MKEDDLPALYSAADRESLRGQGRFLLATKLRLIFLIVAAAAGALHFALGANEFGAVVALLATLGALGVEILLLSQRPERVWYEGRAVAESAKTLAWRYSVAGDPFPATMGPGDARNLLTQRLTDLLHDVKYVTLGDALHGQQITPEMQRLRAEPLATRIQTYGKDRLADQQAWYQRKSQWNETQAFRWTIASIAAELGAIALAALKLADATIGVLIGPVATFAAGIVAWIHARQYGTLARAYGITMQELAAARTQMVSVGMEKEWSAFVDDAEEAMSREHTLWRASRGA